MCIVAELSEVEGSRELSVWWVERPVSCSWWSAAVLCSLCIFSAWSPAMATRLIQSTTQSKKKCKLSYAGLTKGTLHMYTFLWYKAEQSLNRIYFRFWLTSIASATAVPARIIFIAVSSFNVNIIMLLMKPLDWWRMPITIVRVPPAVKKKVKNMVCWWMESVKKKIRNLHFSDAEPLNNWRTLWDWPFSSMLSYFRGNNVWTGQWALGKPLVSVFRKYFIGGSTKCTLFTTGLL